MLERIPSNKIWNSHVQWCFIQQKGHLCLQPRSLDNTLNKLSIAWESFNIRQKLDLFPQGSLIYWIFHSLRQIDVSGWVGLALWHEDLTHEISIFVKTLFILWKKKYILASVKVNLLKTLLILPKTKNLKWFHRVTLTV